MNISVKQEKDKEKELSSSQSEAKDKEKNEDLFTLYDYTVLHTNIDSRRWNDDSAEIIGDSGASAIIFNLANIHLAT